MRIRSLIYWITEPDIFCIHPPPRGLPNRVSNLIIACKLEKIEAETREKVEGFFYYGCVCKLLGKRSEAGNGKERNTYALRARYVRTFRDTSSSFSDDVIFPRKKKAKRHVRFLLFSRFGGRPMRREQDEDGFFRCQMKRGQK